MRRLSLGLIALALMTGLIRRCDAGDRDLDRDVRKQVYQIAEEMLAGRSLLLRIYKDPAAHPDEFQRVTVPLKGSTVSLDTIKSASGSMPDKAVVVVLGSDQTDRQVAAVLDNFVFARTYRPQGEALYLRPPFFDDPGHEWWVFLDALGQPVPEASVEIGLYEANREAKVIVGKGKLDAQGRLRRIKGNFVFTVSHPGYGIATTECTGVPETRDLPETYIVPLVPLDSPAAAGAIQGFVTDTRGQPVVGVTISCMGLTSPAGERLNMLGGRFLGTGVTNEQGRFALYQPILKDGALADSLIPAGSLYQVRIEPSTSLNLRLYEGNIVAGAKATITLSAMQADEFFHTFAFEGQTGSITDPQELKQITLTLSRDDRPWRELTYDQWKNGCSLPTGSLMATTQRWSYPFRFKPVDLRADSPPEIVIREHDPITYRGQVVDGATGEPIPNVLVFIGYPHAGLDPCSITPQQWQELRTRATEQASAQFPSKIFYEREDRLTVTDANGEYEVTFLPGLSPTLSAFAAIQPGYALSSTSMPSYIRPDADGIVQMPPLRMAPPTSAAPAYFPTFTVEDEKGLVTDPNKLKAVRLQIVSDGGWREHSLDDFLKHGQFTPGVYRATATWEDKYYVFQPVDLSESRPQSVVLRPREVLTDSIACQGSVVHGITGRPIPRALVMDHRFGSVPDVSVLTAEQWKAIKAIGPDVDPTSPALAPLMAALAAGIARPVPRMAMTDAQGRFRIMVERAGIDDCRLAIFGENFLCTEQRLVRRRSGGLTQAASPELYGPVANGQVTISPIKVFPAGTVFLEPVVPDYANSDLRRPRLMLSMLTNKDDPAPWLKDLWASPIDSAGASVSRHQDLRPNTRQSLHIPADVTMTLLLSDSFETRCAPLFFPGIRVQQGQILDLGRLEFGPGITVAVKVIDSVGKPVKDARVYCLDDRYGQYGVTAPTNGSGIAEAHVAPSTKGKFALYFFGRSSSDRLETRVAYEVGALEDNGREFILQPSDEFLRRFREGRQERPMPLPLR
jgi:hypothetical protein